MGQPTSIALSKRWSDPSKFSVEIIPTGSASGILASVPSTDLTAAITGIQLAEMNTTPVEGWIGEEWRFATGRLEHYQVQLNFKDYDNFTLYKLWTKAIHKFMREYPDDQKFDIVVNTADDYQIESPTKTVTFKDCILITVGGPNLDNAANASVAEFTVTCKASYVET